MGYSDYHARAFAEAATVEEIEAEIALLEVAYIKFPAHYTNGVGSAHRDYLRMLELRRILAERAVGTT